MRKAYIDIAKGIAIICVIAGHLGYKPLTAFVHSFHMPLFFLISGYFFKYKPGLLGVKIKKYMLPYLFTSLLILAGWEIRSIATVVFGSQPVGMLMKNVKDWLLMTVYASGHRHDFLNFTMPYIGAIWFLPALSWAVALMHWLVGRHRALSVKLFLVLVFFASAYCSALWMWFPFSVQAGSAALLFVFIGYEYREELEGKVKEKTLLAISALLWGTGLISGYRDGMIDMSACVYPDLLVNILGACGATFLIIHWSKGLERVPVLGKYLETIGRYSLVVLCVHLLERNFIPWGVIYEHVNTIFLAHTICFIMKLIIAYVAIVVVKKSKFLSRVYV